MSSWITIPVRITLSVETASTGIGLDQVEALRVAVDERSSACGTSFSIVSA